MWTVRRIGNRQTLIFCGRIHQLRRLLAALAAAGPLQHLAATICEN